MTGGVGSLSDGFGIRLRTPCAPLARTRGGCLSRATFLPDVMSHLVTRARCANPFGVLLSASLRSGRASE